MMLTLKPRELQISVEHSLYLSFLSFLFIYFSSNGLSLNWAENQSQVLRSSFKSGVISVVKRSFEPICGEESVTDHSKLKFFPRFPGFPLLKTFPGNEAA